MLSPPLFYFSFALLDSKFSLSAPFLLYCSISKRHLFLPFYLVFSPEVMPLKICHRESHAILSSFSLVSSLIYQYSVTFVSVLSHYRWIDFSPHSRYIFLLLCMPSYFLLDAQLSEFCHVGRWILLYLINILKPVIFQQYSRDLF